MKTGLILAGVVVGLCLALLFTENFYYGCSNFFHTCAVIQKP